MRSFTIHVDVTTSALFFVRLVRIDMTAKAATGRIASQSITLHAQTWANVLAEPLELGRLLAEMHDLLMTAIDTEEK